jgi:hypothetical protein
VENQSPSGFENELWNLQSAVSDIFRPPEPQIETYMDDGEIKTDQEVVMKEILQQKHTKDLMWCKTVDQTYT